jgi:chromosome segregation ATPase
MLSGREVHDTVGGMIHRVGADVQLFEKEIRDGEREIRDLSGKMEGAYLKLVEIYSPELTAEAVDSIRHLPAIQSEVNAAFERKQRKREELENAMRETQIKRTILSDKLPDLAEDIVKTHSEIDKLKTRVHHTLVESPDYTALVANADEQEKIVTEHESILGEKEAEARRELPRYEHNKLFMYLLDRASFREGNPSGIFGGLVAKLDKKVADTIGFEEALVHYRHLQTMPNEMREEIKQREQALTETKQAIRKKESEIEEKEGLTTALGTGAKLASERQTTEYQIETLDNNYKRYLADRAALDSSKDPYHSELTTKLKGDLQGKELAQLRELARVHPGSEDDQLVDSIEEANRKIRELKNTIAEKKKARDEVATKLSGLQDIHRQTGRHTSSDDYYEGVDVGSFLTGYLTGRYSSTSIASTIERSRKVVYHAPPAPKYHYPSSSHSSHSIAGGFGGGFGGGSHSVGR